MRRVTGTALASAVAFTVRSDHGRLHHGVGEFLDTADRSRQSVKCDVRRGVGTSGMSLDLTE